jgi:hypothetical protein
VREKTVEKIHQWVIKPATDGIKAIKTDLLKPKEVFKVDETVKNQAIALEKQITELEHEIHHIQSILQPQQSESERFPDSMQIIKSLEELYQRNWINIQGSLSVKSQ